MFEQKQRIKLFSAFPLGQSCGRKRQELKEEVHVVVSVIVTVNPLTLYTFFIYLFFMYKRLLHSGDQK